METRYSVLMSVYKNDDPDYLKLAIESMLSQTIPPEQYVIVVDGPISKELNNVIKEYEKNGELFTVICLKKNGGLGNALNEGMKYCRNELVARMDADDISCPKRCEKELEMFEKYSELTICGCNLGEFYQKPENIKTIREVPQDYKSILGFMKKRQPFNHATVMYKKSDVLECGGYAVLKRKEDFDLFSKMLCAGYYARNISEIYYLCRVDEKNYSRRKNWNNFKSAIRVYWMHLKRKGCSLIDFFIICGAEVLFLICPLSIVKWMSDNILRK